MTTKQALGILTSGGDAPGMNAAVRAVVRTALEYGIQPYAIYDGYQGMIEGGDNIRPMSWESVGGVLQRGGTTIGTARSVGFRTREGRRTAAKHLVERKIDSLVVIGGDGSLTGANIFRQEWHELLTELVDAGELDPDQAARHAQLRIAGLVGSIDNDFYGTDMTIGADTALHRITEAVDAITSTAASHQRTFVVEVMGRNCGYLALMGALASGADWVLIPEAPPNLDAWEQKMCDVLRAGREMGRRDSIVIVAEGAQDRRGNPITAQYVKQILEDQLGEDTRITILGHVQRGGSPTAFDRNLSTLLGHHAVKMLMEAPEDETQAFVVGMSGNRLTKKNLMHCVNKTQETGKHIRNKDFDAAMQMRGRSFADSFRILRTLVRAQPHKPQPDQRALRLAVVHGSAPAPGMNTAIRAAVRLGADKGHTMLGVRNGFAGFIAGDIFEMDWMSVNGWAPRGGAELGTNRKVPEGSDFYALARTIEEHRIDGILMIGGWAGYRAVLGMYQNRMNYPAFRIPIVCLPATIDNDLPGSELSIGADSALNNIVSAVDKIKQSAVASRRCFVVEVMGRYCGYLALMSGLATGAERVYLHEEGVTLKDLQTDLDNLLRGFKRGKRLGLMIRNESVNDLYTTDFMQALFEEEGRDLFDVRQAILGHLQQGGDPTPFDRIQATRLASKCIDKLVDSCAEPEAPSSFIGYQNGEIGFHDFDEMARMMDNKYQRPKEQWWLELREVVRLLAQPGPTKH